MKSKRVKYGLHFNRYVEKTNEHDVLVGKPEWKIPLGRPRYWLEDTIVARRHIAK
jgi:hypothetical protein